MIDPTQHQDSDLERCISVALEMLDQGLEPPVEQICKGHEHLISAVSEAIEMSRKLPGLQRDRSEHDELQGRTLAHRYLLKQRLGAGAMGVVYAAQDTELARQVAVKILRPSILAQDEAQARFEREAEALASVQHPAVVTVFDRGATQDDSRFLVMELLEGAPLSDILEQGARLYASDPLGDSSWAATQLGRAELRESSYVRTAASWVADLAAGLGAAHARGVLHRDVKPSNVYIRRDGLPVLLDFGLAARSSSATLTHEDAVLGTPAYMAPEVLDAKQKTGPQADVYGLAATLYHMLALRPPYQGTPTQVFAQLLRDDPDPLPRLQPGIPRDLQAIVERGMARQPSQRYSTAAELEADLRAFLAYRPVVARPLTAVERGWRRMKRSPAFRAGAAVTLVAALVGGGMAWRDFRVDAARLEFDRLWSQIPPGLTLWGHDNRRLNGEEHAALTALLDTAVAQASDPLPARLVRGSLRLDHGDRGGAIEDLRAVARDLGTEYALALLERYERLSADASSALDLGLAGLPAPLSGEDHYLAAYHLLRQAGSLADLRAARDILEREELTGFASAQELLLPVLVGLVPTAATRMERLAKARRVYELAVRLEESQGLRSATTAHVIGGALLGQERYQEAIDPILDGIALAPRFHGLRSNLGIAYRRIGALDEAAEQLQAAIDIRPTDLNPHLTLIRVHLHRDEFDEAQAWIDRAPFGASSRRTRQRLSLEGEVEYGRAILALQMDDPSVTREAARRALERFQEAAALGASVDGVESIVCRAILDEDLGRVFAELAQVLQLEPSNWARLNTLISMMPEDLSASQSLALRGYLSALSRHLAPAIKDDSNPLPSSEIHDE